MSLFFARSAASVCTSISAPSWCAVFRATSKGPSIMMFGVELSTCGRLLGSFEFVGTHWYPANVAQKDKHESFWSAIWEWPEFCMLSLNCRNAPWGVRLDSCAQRSVMDCDGRHITLVGKSWGKPVAAYSFQSHRCPKKKVNWNQHPVCHMRWKLKSETVILPAPSPWNCLYAQLMVFQPPFSACEWNRHHYILH